MTKEHINFLKKHKFYTDEYYYNMEEIKEQMEDKFPEFKDITLSYFRKLVKRNKLKK